MGNGTKRGVAAMRRAAGLAMARRAASKAAAQPASPPTEAELKAAAERRVKTATAQVAKAGRAVKAAERERDRLREANAEEIARAVRERHAADVAAFHGFPAAREAIAEERARAKGEAGKAPVTYAKMLAAEQPMRDARAAYEAAKAVHDASEARRVELSDRYRANYDMSRPGAYDRMRREHPDYRAAERQAWKDDSAKDKAFYAMGRKENAYTGPRDKLAGKIDDAEIRAHPAYAGAHARRDAADARLGELTGDTALRAAVNARDMARAALEDAKVAVAHPSWKYTLHSEPVHSALYTSPDRWPAGTLRAARAADTGVHDRHAGDLALHELQHAQGFDAKPDVVTEDELSAHIKAGEVELWRGDTKPGHTDNMMAGEYHTGLGVRGNGTYAQEGTGDPRSGQHARAVAESYAKSHGNEGGLIMRMSVKAGARVIDYRDLTALAHRTADEARAAEKAARASGDKAALERAQTLLWLATSDTSRLAVAMGYDAVRVADSGQWVILNRSAVRISHQVRG